MPYRFKILTMLIVLPMVLSAQETGMPWQSMVKAGEGITAMEVTLYRGWVELIPSQDDSVHIQFSAYDYDHYDAESKLIPLLTGRGRAMPEVTAKGGKLSIKNGVSREIVALRIHLPKKLNVVININHLGIVKSSGILGEQEVNAFSGRVDLMKLSNAALVHMGRDGDINVSYESISGAIYSAFSTYDGNINLQIGSGSNIAFEAATDLGMVTDEFNLDWKFKSPKEFEVKNADGSIEKKTSYHQSAQMGSKESRFLIKNIRGNIKIKRRQ